MSISKDDLYKNQYDYETLKTNIYVVSLLDILKTQKLTADFCVKYILNTDFQFSEEDQHITVDLVKKLQPQISNLDFVNAQLRATNKKLLGERIDSFEDFVSYADKHNNNSH
jgi:hypothetical protein